MKSNHICGKKFSTYQKFTFFVSKTIHVITFTPVSKIDLFAISLLLRIHPCIQKIVSGQDSCRPVVNTESVLKVFAMAYESQYQ